MKQITIRGVPEEIERIVKDEAKRKGVSLNKSFIALLERATGIRAKAKKKRYHDLDPLFGVWTEEEAATFSSNLDLQRKIDEDLWKQAG